MKNYIIILSILLGFSSCNTTTNEANDTPYEQFGEADISADDAITADAMLDKYKELKDGDTIHVVFKTKVNEVCQTKGCWMMAKLDDKESVRVTFKDYSFFVPMNAAESEAVVQGNAFLNVTSVDELKHYAKDAGKTADEIAAITEEEIGYGFVADAVLLR